MSRQLEDLTIRELMNASSLAEKGKYEKALEKLNKAEKLAEKAKRADLLCRALLHKGEVTDALNDSGESLTLYEKALEISSRLFLNKPQDSSSQKCLYNSIGLIANTLKEIANVSEAEKCYERTNKYFDGIIDTYERLIAEQSENTDYLLNYFKTLVNSTGYFSTVDKAEKEIPLISRALETFKKILNIQPENEEVLKNLDSIIKIIGEDLLKDEFFEDARKDL